MIAGIQWNVHSKDESRYKFVADDSDSTPPWPVSGGKSYVIIQFWNVLRKRGLRTSNNMLKLQQGWGENNIDFNSYLAT